MKKIRFALFLPLLAVALHGELDHALLRELEGVRQQVLQDLLQALGVGLHRGG